MAGCLLEIVARAVLAVFAQVVFTPVVWIICAPHILVSSAFRGGSYAENVRDQFSSVSRWWLRQHVHM